MTWSTVPAKRVYSVIDVRAGRERPPLLAVSIHLGVVPRSALTDDEPRADDLSNYKICKAGDIVVNRMRAFQGAVGISPMSGMVSPDYLVLRPHRVDPRYLHHLFRSKWFVGEMTACLRGIGSTDTGTVRTPRVNADDLGQIGVPIPPAEVQVAIADYLDATTARIDKIVRMKRRLMALLHERFTGWMSERLSASQAAGLERLGPWQWLPLRRVATVHGGLTLGKSYDRARPYPYLRVANVQDRKLDLSEVSVVEVPPNVAARFTLQVGDVLMLEGNGNPENLGRGTIWRGELANCLHQNHVHAIRVDPRQISPEYLDWVVRTPWARWVFSGASEQVSIATLSQSQILDLVIPVPPLVEQTKIVAELDASAHRLHALTAVLDAQIELLGEHRQALVTAAVTGGLEIP